MDRSSLELSRALRAAREPAPPQRGKDGMIAAGAAVRRSGSLGRRAIVRFGLQNLKNVSMSGL
jgi:hypothetical protein